MSVAIRSASLRERLNESATFMPRSASARAIAAPIRRPPVMIAALPLRAPDIIFLVLAAQPGTAGGVGRRRALAAMIDRERAGTDEGQAEECRDQHQVVFDAVAHARRHRPVDEEAVGEVNFP